MEDDGDKRIWTNVVQMTDYIYEDEPSLVDVDDLFRNLDNSETRMAGEQRLAPADSGVLHARMVFHHLKQLALHDVELLYQISFEVGTFLQDAEIEEEEEE